jgi:dephospho-CoA kinase
LERATQRSGLSEDEVRAIMAAQLTRAERLARADDVLPNDGSIEDLRQKVNEQHSRYLGLARDAAPQAPRES